MEGKKHAPAPGLLSIVSPLPLSGEEKRTFSSLEGLDLVFSVNSKLWLMRGAGRGLPSWPSFAPGSSCPSPSAYGRGDTGAQKGLKSHSSSLHSTSNRRNASQHITSFETGKWVTKVRKPWQNCPVVASRSPRCCSAHPHLYSISSPPGQGMVAIKCDMKYLGLSFVFLY